MKTKTKTIRIDAKTNLERLHDSLRQDGTEDVRLAFFNELASRRFSNWMAKNGYDRPRVPKAP